MLLKNDLKNRILTNLEERTVLYGRNGLPDMPVRLIYGRGGREPGFEDINIDIYPPLVYITVYCGFTDAEIGEIGSAAESVFQGQPVIVQDRSVRPAVIRLKIGEIPGEMIVEEAGLKYFLNPERGQNPGFFPDMRNGRALISGFIKQRIAESGNDSRDGVSVLNLFSYTCALSVVSLAAGASRVVNIDKNKRSLDLGRSNHRLNNDSIPGGFRNQAVFLPHDIFKSIGKLKREGPYDLIIADPPPSQKGSFMLKTDYPRLLRRLPEMLKPEGVLLLSLNSPGWSWVDFEDIINQNLPVGPEAFKYKRIQPPEDYSPAEDGRGLKLIIAGTGRLPE